MGYSTPLERQAPLLSSHLSRFRVWMSDLVALIKLRIVFTLTLYAIVSALTAGGGHVPPDRLVIFSILILMASGGAACLNHLFERDIDACMERTRARPLPAGRVRPGAVALLAAVLLGTAIPLAWAVLGKAVAIQLAAGAIVYAGVYTLVLKRRTPWNIVIGGAAGSHAALAGWALVDPSLGLGGWLLALVVFLWTPPHFWGLAIARDADYRAAHIPMLPQVAGTTRAARAMTVYAAATWAASLMLVPYTALGTFYAIVAMLLGGAFTAGCAALWRRPEPHAAMTVYKSSGLYLALLLVGMTIDLLLG